jgi:hypothetical protein
MNNISYITIKEGVSTVFFRGPLFFNGLLNFVCLFPLQALAFRSNQHCGKIIINFVHLVVPVIFWDSLILFGPYLHIKKPLYEKWLKRQKPLFIKGFNLFNSLEFDNTEKYNALYCFNND